MLQSHALDFALGQLKYTVTAPRCLLHLCKMNRCFQTYSWSTVPVAGDASVGRVLSAFFFRTVLFVRALWYLRRTVGHSGCLWLPEFLLIPSKEKHIMSQDSQCSRLWIESPWQHFSIQILHLSDFASDETQACFITNLKKNNTKLFFIELQISTPQTLCIFWVVLGQNVILSLLWLEAKLVYYQYPFLFISQKKNLKTYFPLKMI